MVDFQRHPTDSLSVHGMACRIAGHRRRGGTVEILTGGARTELSSRCPGPTLSTLCNVGLAGNLAGRYRAPYGPCFEAHRKSYSLEGERRPIQPGRAHTGDRGDHGKYQPKGGAGVNQQTVEAERTPEPEVIGRELPFEGSRGLLCAGGQ